jgi:O-antigen ligase
MNTKKQNLQVAKAYKKIMLNDVLIGLIMLVPAIYIAYVVFHWQFVSQSFILLGLFWASLVLVAINLLAEFLNWRCPHCRVFMGMVYNPKYCPRCGMQLR